MNEWISVKDRLPKPNTEVLLVRRTNKGPDVTMGYKLSGDWWYIAGSRIKAVTHWMPKPEPPQREEETE